MRPREGTCAGAVFVTGGTGYIGSRLIPVLIARGHTVRVLTRPQSVERVPRGASPVVGDAPDPGSFGPTLRSDETVVHLVGTPHPNPSKAREFERVDLASIRSTVAAARDAGTPHLIYISVAQPAPIMKAYLAVRAAGERAIADARLTATILRPWYVLGPGHRWPLVLVPVYAVAGVLPATRESAKRLGLVTLRQMVGAIVRFVEDPPGPRQIRIVEVPDIRRVPIDSRYAA